MIKRKINAIYKKYINKITCTSKKLQKKKNMELFKNLLICRQVKISGRKRCNSLETVR